jgi:hypothetical protein
MGRRLSNLQREVKKNDPFRDFGNSATLGLDIV